MNNNWFEKLKECINKYVKTPVSFIAMFGLVGYMSFIYGSTILTITKDYI